MRSPLRIHCSRLKRVRRHVSIQVGRILSGENWASLRGASWRSHPYSATSETFFFLCFQVVLRRIPVGTGDTGPAAVRRGGPVRDDGVSSGRIPAGSTTTLPRRTVRRYGRLLAWSLQGSANYASAARLLARLPRRARRIHLKSRALPTRRVVSLRHPMDRQFTVHRPRFRI